MTRATKESGVRRSARRAGAVAVLAAGALLVGGCGSSGDDGGKGDDAGGTPESSASTSASPSEGASHEASAGASEGASGDGQGSGGNGGAGSGSSGGTGGSGDSGGSGSGSGKGGKAGKLAGVWKVKGKQVVLTVVGDSVTLLREEGRNCTGTLGGAGKRTVTLKCPSGADDTRTKGTVGALKSKSMTVSWQGGPTEAYARVTDAPVQLPEDQ
ncbi:hypothetical protein [Streptomyces nanshensis]|uniref:Lipoprotein n=1 Tax=Streptomyces nanshensis TaxID=518642 RepID=A0A1E7L6F6_9ACTN|nr:hypothetical protein [Streptomyces nanshensis]OEV11786.1 hypothetical protein AN218_11400 [Streptomyces nanshensis]